MRVHGDEDCHQQTILRFLLIHYLQRKARRASVDKSKRHVHTVTSKKEMVRLKKNQKKKKKKSETRMTASVLKQDSNT